MKRQVYTLAMLPAILWFASFTNSGHDELYSDSDKSVAVREAAITETYEQFIRSAYEFRVKNKLEVPDFYYDVLKIDNPNTPAWVKAPAIEPPPEPRLRDQIPMWIRKGQLMKESSSFYNADGTIKYVNKNRGGNNHRRGAIGPFQVLRIAWDHMRKENPEFFRGKQYSDMQRDLKLNEDVAAMYLLYIYNGRGNKNWNTTVMLYNCGPWGDIDRDAREYLRKVKEYGKE